MSELTTNHDETSGAPGAIRCDVAVIGGGLAGLTAAATAARAGARVTLIEAHSLGGRARSVERDGFTLNEGAHALYRSAGGWDVLDGLGVRLSGETPPAADYRTVWNDEIAVLPIETRTVLSSKLLGVRSKMKLGKWFGDLAKAADTCGDGSLDEWLTDQRAASDLRKYMLAVCRLSTYSARPEIRPAAAMLRQLVAGSDGVRYLHGGWQSMVAELERVAREAGVSLVEREPVLDVSTEAGRWSVSTEARTVVAESVVFAAGGPSLAASLLGGDDAGWVERAGPAQRAACLDIAGPAGDVSFLLSADRPLYLSQHLPVAGPAPDDRHLYSLMRYMEDDDPNTAGENRSALEAHAARAGLPAGDRRAVERFLASMVVTWGTPQVGVTRPTGAELSDRGVWAAGDWVGVPLLADASIVSGAASGRAAADRAMVRV